VVFEHIGGTVGKLTWAAPSTFDPAGYLITIDPATTGGRSNFDVFGSTNLSISDLDSNTSYCAVVSAFAKTNKGTETHTSPRACTKPK
jgi:hypothetical protein